MLHAERPQGSLFDYGGKGKGRRPDIYSSPHESLFQFTPHQQRERSEDHEQRGVRDDDAGGSTLVGERPSGVAERTPCFEATGDIADQERELAPTSSKEGLSGPGHSQQQLRLRVTYAGKGFDPRRMCGGCTEELRAAIVSSGHDLEVWHTVDHERRALTTAQRQNDVLKARWAERERKDRQVRRVKSTTTIRSDEQSVDRQGGSSPKSGDLMTNGSVKVAHVPFLLLLVPLRYLATNRCLISDAFLFLPPPLFSFLFARPQTHLKPRPSFEIGIRAPALYLRGEPRRFQPALSRGPSEGRARYSGGRVGRQLASLLSSRFHGVWTQVVHV